MKIPYIDNDRLHVLSKRITPLAFIDNQTHIIKLSPDHDLRTKSFLL